MGPSEIDSEIQLMDDNLLSVFLQFLLSRFKTNDDFELNETYLHLVLKVSNYMIFCFRGWVFI